MPTITRRSNRLKPDTFLAQARVRGCKPMARTFADPDEAERWAKATEKAMQAERRGGRRVDQKLTVGTLIDRYLKDRAVCAKKSYPGIAQILTWWSDHYGTVDVLDFRAKLRAAREEIVKTRGNATTNRYLSAMRSCWSWSQGEGEEGTISADLRWPRKLMLEESTRPDRFLSAAELSALLKVAQQDVVMNAAVVTSLGTGLRTSELCRLEWRDINLTGENSPTGPRLLVRISKTKKQRSVFLPANVVAALTALKESGLSSPTHVFILKNGAPMTRYALDSRWTPIRKAAKLTDFRWHDIRHTFASYLLQDNTSLAAVGVLMGHTNPATTQRYAHLVQGAEVVGHAALNARLAPRS